MIRTFCDCCGDEITAKNDPACGNKRLGRLTAQVMPKIGGMGEVMAVEVITAHEGTWNKGHFCKYCVIDAINTLDDRPHAATKERIAASFKEKPQPKDCPHAAPFRYCAHCKVSPCPMGLDMLA